MSFGKLLEGLMQAAGQTASRGSKEVRWEQVGAGAAVGGALGLLLGNKSRKLGGMGGKAVKYGSVAALGYAAWKVYEQHQRNQQQAAQASPAAPAAMPPANPWQGALPAPALELHSRLMLKAMIAAAKADGHVDERERGLIEAELQRQNADPSERSWLEQELRRPLDPAEVAAAVTAPEQAAEVYLASVLVADETSFMERAYLDELARQLRLPDSLKRDLEAQA